MRRSVVCFRGSRAGFKEKKKKMDENDNHEKKKWNGENIYMFPPPKEGVHLDASAPQAFRKLFGLELEEQTLLLSVCCDCFALDHKVAHLERHVAKGGPERKKGNKRKIEKCQQG